MHFNDDEEIGWLVEGDPWEQPELESHQAISDGSRRTPTAS